MEQKISQLEDVGRHYTGNININNGNCGKHKIRQGAQFSVVGVGSLAAIQNSRTYGIEIEEEIHFVFSCAVQTICKALGLFHSMELHVYLKREAGLVCSR